MVFLFFSTRGTEYVIHWSWATINDIFCLSELSLLTSLVTFMELYARNVLLSMVSSNNFWLY